MRPFLLAVCAVLPMVSCDVLNQDTYVLTITYDPAFDISDLWDYGLLLARHECEQDDDLRQVRFVWNGIPDGEFPTLPRRTTISCSELLR